MAHSDQFVWWTFEYPGHIVLYLDGGGVWAIGTANGTYAADLYIDQAHAEGGDPDKSIDTGIPEANRDYPAIAAALFAAMSAI